MTVEDKKSYAELTKKLSGTDSNNHDVLREFGKLMSRLDSFNPLPIEVESMTIDFEIYQNVWDEASRLRTSGQLLEYGSRISCPVVAIHGKHDPHPYKGVIEPLSKVIRDFKYILLEECGHIPWIERNAKDHFQEILLKEIE
jgi:pimeloyl-ACP methyl ester carboxylesterase